ncbi:hypothetical protein H4W00_002158 [Psychrobacter sp. PL19]|uniref:tetratricopeptide repeat protein n=1 Tax=Psychrobacter sp. PL19 TaxID=2760711 RepID=UPI002FF3C98A
MPAMSVSPLTPLDYIAEGYWQDFLASRPIAGGIAYKVELHNCQLDGSLISLQRIDTLLSQIRRDLVKSDTWNETTILADERYRNLLVFLAFYAGRVLARQWQNPPHWYGQFELRTHYPELLLTVDDFYQHMAVLYNEVSATAAAHDTKSSGNEDSNRVNHNEHARASVFFVLEPIGLRLFGHIDRQFRAVQGGQVANGLYQAVSARLPNIIAEPTAARLQANNALNSSATISPNATQSVTATQRVNDDLLPEIGAKEALAVSHKATDKTAPNIGFETTTTIIDTRLNNLASDTLKPIVSLADSRSTISTTTPLTNDDSSSALPKAKVPSTASPTPEIFIQLLIELDEIEVVQTAGDAEYQRACKVLDQFERHIAKQNKPRAQVVFLESHQAAKQHALKMLQNAATLGNTTAMIRLAMYELLDEGLLADHSVDAAISKDTTTGEAAGVDWIKQAANEKDIRAQRLLSKIYYQGIGVPQDINNGKYWLEQAAENGHVEAASLVGQWQQAQALITTRQQEQHSIKRYQLLIGVIVVVALLLIIFV